MTLTIRPATADDAAACADIYGFYVRHTHISFESEPPSDAEMAERIAEHRRRRGAAWLTVETPEDLEGALAREAGEGRAMLVDCLTLWLSNVMLAGADVEKRGAALVEAARKVAGLRVFVSNEVGLGLVPETPLGRRFRDAQGRLNQAMAATADQVVFMAAGLPLVLKGQDQ